MPINKAYPLEELMKAIDYYTKENNRRLTFEYILLNGVNNSVEDAKELARLLRPYNCYVNLIPYNSVDEHGFRPVNREEAMKFYDVLKKEKSQSRSARNMVQILMRPVVSCGLRKSEREGNEIIWFK